MEKIRTSLVELPKKKFLAKLLNIKIGNSPLSLQFKKLELGTLISFFEASCNILQCIFGLVLSVSWIMTKTVVLLLAFGLGGRPPSATKLCLHCLFCICTERLCKHMYYGAL